MNGNNIDIYEDLKNKIINTEILPGTKLSENNLASEYNISRTPIRQVLQRLSAEQLVKVFPQKGTYVTKVSISKVRDSIFLRKCIETEIFKLATQSESREELIKELKSNLKKQEQLSSNDHAMFNYLDNLFHYTFYHYTKRESIAELFMAEAFHYTRLRILFERMYDISSKVDEHRKIIEMLEQGNCEGYYDLLHQHLKPLSEEIELGHYSSIEDYIEE